MRSSAVGLLALGIITALAGLTFTLQGLGVVGPAGGLMYQSPTWVTQGELVFVVGVVLVIAAFALNKRRPATKA